VEIPNYFYKFHLTSERLDQPIGDFVEKQGGYEITGEKYYPFRSIIE